MSDYYIKLRKKLGTDLLFNPSVGAIIRKDEGEILFQRSSLDSDVWSLPAGSIEPGETPGETVIREVWEETGLHVIPSMLLGVFGGKDFRYISHLFRKQLVTCSGMSAMPWFSRSSEPNCRVHSRRSDDTRGRSAHRAA